MRIIGLLISTCALFFSCGDGSQQKESSRLSSELMLFPESMSNPIKVIETNDARLIIGVDASDIKTRSIRMDDMYSDVRIPGFEVVTRPGEPSVPFSRVFVRVPNGKDIRLQVIEEDINEDFHLSHPISYARNLEVHGGKAIVARRNESAYQEFFGSVAAKIVDYSFAASERVATVEIFPLSYDATNNDVVHRRYIKILFSFDAVKSGGANRKLGKAPVGAQTPSHIAPYLLNPRDEQTSSYGIQKDLIIAHESFRGVLDDFIKFKQSVGREVVVKYVANQSAQQIKKLVAQEYGADFPPAHTLLVGNIDQIPSFRGSGDNSWTDFYYTTLDSGNIPDISLGRIPAHDAAELRNFITKVIAREGQVSDSDKILVTSGKDVGMGCPLNARKVGQNIVGPNPSVSVTNLSRSTGDTQSDIIDGYNDNPNIVIYDGHGYQQGMSEVPLLIRDLPKLTNRSYPIILDIACLNANWNRGANVRNFAEKIILHPESGAAGIMAAGGSSGGHQFFQNIGALIAKARKDMEIHERSIYNEIGNIVMTAKIKASMSDKTYFNYYGDPASSVFIKTVP